MKNTYATEISRKASDIAGAIWDDRRLCGTIEEQLLTVASAVPMGTDGDLTAEDRRALRDLARDARSAE